MAELLATAFKVHPYRNPISGWPSDTRNLRRNAAKDFYERYYGPGNITIAIVGDVVPADARRMAEHYFGPMEAKPPAPVLHTEEPPQDGPKTVVVEANGPPVVAVAFKRPSQYDKDDAAFDVMQYVLSQGNGGMLHREFIQEKHLAANVQVAATFPSGPHPNLMIFLLLPAQGRTAEENQRALDDFLGRFKNLTLDAQTLAHAKAQLRAAFLQRCETSSFMAEMLAIHNAQYGDWRKIFTALDDLNKVTPDAVQRAASKYLVATGRTTAYLVAPGQSGILPPAPRALPAERKTGGDQ